MSNGRTERQCAQPCDYITNQLVKKALCSHQKIPVVIKHLCSHQKIFIVIKSSLFSEINTFGPFLHWLVVHIPTHHVYGTSALSI